MSDESSESHETEGRDVEFEHYLSREEVTDHFESFLEGFREGETVTMTIGDETIEIDPPEHLGFELEYEEDGDDRELEFELEWQVKSDELDIDSS
ncbi:amphi-Trp domain-containing protein [Natronolimnohabitans sp. A-GB9]|uniref:amphi-Trp domain-containing protein n=1 Tax=Natronolimnohabitans sp. A-GB9 TaxID=3069757 RepID=UPI0027B6A711|nr:amphi-Trp domain-containing protein [Natronolimnohabitans sp. A-GB9]MDQ2051541.1 amphi-Trp domain-containing protein [Natronolimnohabitans sp. A-GB9]